MDDLAYIKLPDSLKSFTLSCKNKNLSKIDLPEGLENLEFSNCIDAYKISYPEISLKNIGRTPKTLMFYLLHHNNCWVNRYNLLSY